MPRTPIPQFSYYLGLVISLFFICQLSFGQHCSPLYKRVYGGTGHDEPLFILATPDKGAVIAGRTSSQTTGDFNGFLMKLTQGGAIEWNKSFGGAGHEELHRVCSTSDGGYLALAQAKTNNGSYPFLLKTDATGGLQWARKFSKNAASLRGKDIVVLKDNSYALLLNEEDSTVAGNGIICKLSASGTITWAKAFDQGQDDGFNTIATDGDSLVVGGHATLKNRDAVLMKVSANDGSVFWAKRMARKIERDDEVLKADVIPGGLAFTITTSNYLLPGGGFAAPAFLGMFKRMNSGTYTDAGVAQLSSSVGMKVEGVVSHLSLSGQFVYLVNDTVDRGGTRMVKMDNGYAEFGRDLWESYPVYSRTYGLDTSTDGGYWAVGFYRNWDMPSNKMVVYKMDKLGLAGSCIRQTAGAHTELNDYAEDPFVWSRVSDAGLFNSSLSVTTTDLNFSQFATCDSSYCTVAPPTTECKATYLMHLRSDNRIRLMDVEQANDGGTIAVGQKFLRPFIVKVSPDGNLQWSKTYTQFVSSLLLKKIIPTADGNYLVVGINTAYKPHSSGSTSVLMKINGMGDVLWSHEYEAADLNIYTVAPTPDGGYIVCATGGYGIGYTYSYLFRVTSTGSVVWKRNIGYETHYPIYKSLFLDGDDLYALSDTYQSTSIFRLEKWDATSGTMRWNKRFLAEESRIYADFLTKIKDTVYVGLYEIRAAGWMSYKANLCIGKFDTSGNMQGAFTLTQPNFSMSVYDYDGITAHQPFSMVQTADANFVVAQQVQPFSDTRLRITKFTPAGAVLWSQEYPELSSHMVRSIKTDGSNFYFAVL